MLSPNAEKIIEKYFNLPFTGVTGVRCPYYINRRGMRAQLRVLAGKGSPEEIVEESKIISTQYKLGLFEKNGDPSTPSVELIRKFLIEQSLGIECSGFVSHILKAHFLETKKLDITKKLSVCPKGKILRQLICKLRPIENMGVLVYTDSRNSEVVDVGKNGYSELRPGDIITMLETGPNQKRNHIILIRETENKTISYVHSRTWNSEGRYGHGVTEGKIIIKKDRRGLLEQDWIECEKTNSENETYIEAKQAKILEIRRLKLS